MEKEELIPGHVFERFKNKFKNDNYPNIVRTLNIKKDGLDILTNKNKVIWSSTVFDGNNFHFIEGIIWWGSNDVFIYFEKIENDSSYKLFILTLDLDNIKTLLVGLNKFYTIDKV